MPNPLASTNRRCEGLLLEGFFFASQLINVPKPFGRNDKAHYYKAVPDMFQSKTWLISSVAETQSKASHRNTRNAPSIEKSNQLWDITVYCQLYRRQKKLVRIFKALMKLRRMSSVKLVLQISSVGKP